MRIWFGPKGLHYEFRTNCRGAHFLWKPVVQRTIGKCESTIRDILCLGRGGTQFAERQEISFVRVLLPLHLFFAIVTHAFGPYASER